MSGVHICSFSTDLDDLPKKHHGSDVEVLRVLYKTKRFSYFEINTDALARTIARLFKNGQLIDDGGQYPWQKIKLSADALKMISVEATDKREAAA